MSHLDARLRWACCPLLLVAACVPGRAATFDPVSRDVERRLGLPASWQPSTDSRVPAAVAALLEAPLDRDTAIRIALANNRRLQAHYEALGIAASDIAAATVLGPAEVEVTHSWAPGGAHGDTEIEVTQDLLALVQLRQRRAVARADLEAAQARAVAATVQLAARVETAWIDLVAAQQDLELRQAVLEAAQASAELVEGMHRAGNTTDLALAREQAQRAEAEMALARAERQVQLRREPLNELLGLAGPRTTWTAPGHLPELPAQPPVLDHLERDAVAGSLELRALGRETDAAAERLRMARARAWLPILAAGISAERSDAQWHVGPSVHLGLPLFDQQQGPRARARAELQRARHLHATTAIEVLAAARAARERLLEAHAEARYLASAIIPLRQQVLDHTLDQYNAMNASTFEVLAARRELVEAARQHTDAVRRYWLAEIEARALARGASLPPASAEREPARSTSSSPEGH